MKQAPCRISGILLCCNSAGFVADALHSALAQDVESMQLIVSDDASTDDTFEILRREVDGYEGHHQVELWRRTTNSGSKSAHLNDVLPRTEGDIIVSFDDDDVSAPHRVRRLTDAFDADPRVMAVYSRYKMIDEEGHDLGPGRVPHPPTGSVARRWFSRVDAYAAGTTLAVRREVVEKFGPLDADIHEDIVLPFRASLLGDVRYLDEALVGVRRRSDSLTAHPERFESIESYRRGMRRGIERARRHLQSRRRDLDVARRLMPERHAELQELEDLANLSLEHAEATFGLVSPSSVERIRALLRLVRAGAYHEDLVANLGLVFAPGMYLRFKRRHLGPDRRKTADRARNDPV